MSGWTNVTLEIDEDAIEPVASSQQPDPEEVVRSEMEERGFRHIESLTFQANIRHWGQPSGRYSDGEAYELMREVDVIERMLVVYANDTGDDGVGWLYERDGDSIEVVDEKQGYGGARGHDVTGYFSDEHGIHGTASPRW